MSTAMVKTETLAPGLKQLTLVAPVHFLAVLSKKKDRKAVKQGHISGLQLFEHPRRNRQDQREASPAWNRRVQDPGAKVQLRIGVLSL